ncbi:MAG: TIGR00730 family Rossman fold protein [Gemmataceae bacterium]
MPMKRLCVFCGSSCGDPVVYASEARKLGSLLAQRGIDLVFGAGHIGLMGVVADAVLASGGRAIGVIPNSLVERELCHQQLTETHVVNSMHERKALMADFSDGFLALPGGFGTADEFFEILTWAQLKFHRKPIGLCNINGFFDPLLAWIDRAVADGFIKAKYYDLLTKETNAEALLDALIRKAATTRPAT